MWLLNVVSNAKENQTRCHAIAWINPNTHIEDHIFNVIRLFRIKWNQSIQTGAKTISRMHDFICLMSFWKKHNKVFAWLHYQYILYYLSLLDKAKKSCKIIVMCYHVGVTPLCCYESCEMLPQCSGTTSRVKSGVFSHNFEFFQFPRVLI